MHWISIRCDRNTQELSIYVLSRKHMKPWLCGSICIHFKAVILEKTYRRAFSRAGRPRVVSTKHTPHSCGETPMAKNSTLYTPPQ